MCVSVSEWISVFTLQHGERSDGFFCAYTKIKQTVISFNSWPHIKVLHEPHFFYFHRENKEYFLCCCYCFIQQTYCIHFYCGWKKMKCVLCPKQFFFTNFTSETSRRIVLLFVVRNFMNILIFFHSFALHFSVVYIFYGFSQ